MKPILIDALHIVRGGGLMILNHLINALLGNKIDFILIKDSRSAQLEHENQISNLTILSSDFKTRKKFYQKNIGAFSKVLCFGNVPPPIKLTVPVYTYFHNVNILKIPSDYSFKQKMLSLAKRLYLRLYSKNTTAWIVQTSYTAYLVKKYIATPTQKIHLFPFYYIAPGMNQIPINLREDYVYISNYFPAKGHEYLLDAWKKLASLGYSKRLHVTVWDPIFKQEIDNAITDGVNIINHGKIDFTNVVQLYNKSKATIYPSLNESLGLGIVEAITAGCDVIGCGLPYMDSVCNASVKFAPRDSDSIVEAVIKYENGQTQKTSLKIHDTINEFIDFLSK